MHPLLTPRLLVTGPYPFNPYKVGEVIMPDDLGRIIIAKIEVAKKYGGYSCHTHFEQWKTAPAIYPALFRLCEWWEFCKPEDMPEYVKVHNYIVLPVKKHFHISERLKATNSVLLDENGTLVPFYYAKALPTTIEDYNKYINNLNK